MSYRVLQWATGNVGRASLRAVLAHPELELAGVYATNPAKIGKDAGELCRRDATGIRVTGDVDELLATDADCVLHMPLPSRRYGENPEQDLEDIVRCLRAGKNVVTTVGYVYPKAYGPEAETALEDACRAGGSSVHGTGLNPGWLGDLLPLVMSGLSERIDRITVAESTDFSFYPSPEIICEMMGLGKTPEVFDQSAERYVSWLSGLFGESLWLVADGLALAIDDVRREVELWRAERRFEIAAGVIEPGTISAQRFRWTGVSGGAERLVFECVYRAHAETAPEWTAPGCSVVFEGRPGMSIVLDEGWVTHGLSGTAMHAVHAVPAVCDAAPGVRTFLDLPLITGRHTFTR